SRALCAPRPLHPVRLWDAIRQWGLSAPQARITRSRARHHAQYVGALAASTQRFAVGIACYNGTRMKMHGLLLSAALLSLPLTAIAQDRNSIAFQRAQHLQHGINTSMWFAQADDYSPQRLETYTTAKDIALIEQMGFDHCRLSIDAGPLVEW